MTNPHPSTLLTGLSLKPKPKKSRAITRWNLSVRPSQIYKKERDGSHFCVLPLPSPDLHQQEFHPFFNLTDFTIQKSQETTTGLQMILLESVLFLIMNLYGGRNFSFFFFYLAMTFPDCLSFLLPYSKWKTVLRLILFY